MNNTTIDDIKRLMGKPPYGMMPAEDCRPTLTNLLGVIARQADALKGLHNDNAEYQKINNLGGYDNHWMVGARKALAESAPYVQLSKELGNDKVF